MDAAAGGGINGKPETFYLEGPDGDRVSLAGTWKSKKLADYAALPPRPVDMNNDPNWSTVLYNAMINPLVPYSIKGAIWYQGCSNEERAYQYRDLMTLMIEDWRKAWGYEFPFYITQLSSFMDYQTVPCESSWAELREAQSIAAKMTANTGMAVTIDIGDAKDIHPKNKQEVGRRLALQAFNKTYGMPVECSGPVYEGYEVSGNVIRIRFSSVGKGLVAKGGKLEGFAVAGADRKFYWADAKIAGDCIELTCKDVERPIAVRYAWANNPVGNLFNAAGLPASHFRTDDWPGLTVGKTVRER
jgi:sialate O-acetylesterase